MFMYCTSTVIPGVGWESVRIAFAYSEILSSSKIWTRRIDSIAFPALEFLQVSITMHNLILPFTVSIRGQTFQFKSPFIISTIAQPIYFDLACRHVSSP